MKIEDRDCVQLFVRCQLDDKLKLCSAEQVALFRKLYGAVVPKAKLADALDLVERTIRKNETTGRYVPSEHSEAEERR